MGTSHSSFRPCNWNQISNEAVNKNSNLCSKISTKIIDFMYGIVSLSPVIWIKSLLFFAHLNQARTAHDVFVCIFCGVQDAFLFWSFSSSTIGIILPYRKLKFSVNLLVLPWFFPQLIFPSKIIFVDQTPDHSLLLGN